MTLYVEWTPEDFAVGFQQLRRLEEGLVTAALVSKEPSLQTMQQIAQLARIAVLIGDEIFEYTGQKDILSKIANLAADVVSPYGISVVHDGKLVKIPDSLSLKAYALVEVENDFWISKPEIVQSLSVPDTRKAPWSLSMSITTLESFQEIFACVAPRSHRHTVKEAASRIELTLRSAVAIARGINKGQKWQEYEKYIVSKLQNALSGYGIQFGDI